MPKKGKDLSRHQHVAADIGLRRSFAVVFHLPLSAKLEASEELACDRIEEWMTFEIRAGRKPITGTLGISTTRAVTLDAVSHSTSARIPIVEFSGEVLVRDPNETATYDAEAYTRLSELFFLISASFENLGGGITIGNFEWEACLEHGRYFLREMWSSADLQVAFPSEVSN